MSIDDSMTMQKRDEDDFGKLSLSWNLNPRF